MQLTSFKRTALFKSGGRNIIVLKITLPRALPDFEDERFCESFNSFYRDLSEECIAACERLCGRRGEELKEKYSYPVICSMEWEKLSKAPVRTKSKISQNLISICRTMTLSSLGMKILNKDFHDVFDSEHGYIIK